MAIKDQVKELLLAAGVYYKISDQYSENKKKHQQQKEFYSQFIHKDDLVFDVGANVGQRSKVFSELCKQVIAIEPQPYCLKHLHSRFMYSKNVVIVPNAIDVAEGVGMIYPATSHTISSMSETFIRNAPNVIGEVAWGKPLEVKTIPLDTLIRQYGVPAFIKIDVEGYELNVLNSLLHTVRFISFEFAPPMIEEAEKCIDRLNEISSSYRFNYSLGEDLNFRLASHQTFAEFKSTTLVELSTAETFGDIYAILPG